MNNRSAEPQARRSLHSSVVRRRIFVAVALAPALLAAVSGMRARLAEAESTLRWVPPENLHFTLKFLGGITPPRLAGVVAAA
ncbi:MAG TPA: 2'-5' RNA ligase family protein, partial [bacterium]|nr:2'-5' RNA ligase family protein [bacterium]